MKATILSLLTFMFLFSGTMDAQCLENGDFAEFCGTQQELGGSCPYFSYPCVSNWKRSHGTPQIMVPDANPIDNLAYMWFANSSIGLIGEGIFASYSFKKSTSYIITIRLDAITQASGQIFLYAANNMAEGRISGCGDPLPTVNSKELITQINEYNKGWKTYTISYTPTSDYSQLWLYPYTTSTSQFNLYVDYVFACPDTCATGTVIYNHGQVPVGDTKAGYIFAGSSAGTGGSGIVTVASDQTTTFIATNEIDLLPNFTATVTSGQFIARIVQSCGSVILERNNPQDIDVSQFPKDPVDSVEEEPAIAKNESGINESVLEFKIYPNPSKGIIFIQPGVSAGERISIEVLDVNGHILQKTESVYNGGQVLLNASSYKVGYYFIKVKSGNFIKVGKVFIE